MTNECGKPRLRFSSDGVFRMLMMSDIQESADYDPRSLASVRKLLDRANPDFVMLGGDNCCGHLIKNTDDLRRFLEIFAGEIEKRGIPWAHIFGNHDHDSPCGALEQQKVYESFPLCLSGHTDGIHGTTNFVLPVCGHSDGRVRFHIWGLDTNNSVKELDAMVPGGNMYAKALLPNNTLSVGKWGFLYFDQLMWYWNTSCLAEKEHGGKIPGIMCMHIAPHEFTMAAANPEPCVKSGSFGEALGTYPFNCGIFAELLQRGDIHTLSCGHTHENDFEAEYCGIRLCWDACAGYGSYGIDALRGGRVFEFREDDPWHAETYMIRTSDAVYGRT